MNKEEIVKIAKDFLADTNYAEKDMYKDCEYKTYPVDEKHELDMGYVTDGDEKAVTIRLVEDGEPMEAISTMDMKENVIADCAWQLLCK